MTTANTIEISGATLKYSPEECQHAYDAMGKRLNQKILSSSRPVMIVTPMQGAAIVLGEMIRRVHVRATYRCVDISLYNAANQVGEAAEFKHWPIEDDELKMYDFIVVDDVAESLRTYQAGRERLMAYGAQSSLITLLDKPTKHRVPGLHPDFAPLSADESEWLIGEGMNDGDTVTGQQWRMIRGVWVKNP